MKFTRVGILKAFTPENQDKGSTRRTRQVSCAQWCTLGFLAACASVMGAAPASALADAPSAPLSAAQSSSPTRQSMKGVSAMSEDKRSTTGAPEMKAAQALTTKVLAIGSWTAKATPET